MKRIATVAGVLTAAAYGALGDWSVVATVAAVVVSLHAWTPRWSHTSRPKVGQRGDGDLDGLLLYVAAALVPSLLWLLRS